MKYDILFKNALLVTMDDDNKLLKDSCIGVLDKKIGYLGKLSDEFTAKRVVDCAGNILMPGLINTHAHLAMSLMRGYSDDLDLDTWLFKKIFPLEAKIDAKCVYIGTMLSIAEAISSGTSSITDNYFFSPEIAKAAVESGIKINICNMITHFKDEPYDPTKDRAIMETNELLSTVHMYDEGRIMVDIGIHAPYTSCPDVWSYVANFALFKKLNIGVHLSETIKEKHDISEKYHKTSTEALRDSNIFKNHVLCAHGVYLSDDDISILAEAKASISHCPVSNLKLASGVCDLPKLIKHGVNVSLGTDGTCSNNKMDMFEEIKLSALLHKGINLDPKAVGAYDALKMATVNGAKAQNRYKNTGKLKVGFDADIIMIDTNKLSFHPMHDAFSSLVYASNGSDVILNMVKGKILYENGSLITIDVEKIKYMLHNYALPTLGIFNCN